MTAASQSVTRSAGLNAARNAALAAALAGLALACALLVGCTSGESAGTAGTSNTASNTASNTEGASTPSGDSTAADGAVVQRFADDTVMAEYLFGYYTLQAGDAAPDFTVEVADENGLTGETLSLADLSGGAVLLDFWAPWCPYCVTDMPAWQQIAEEYGDAVTIVAVDVGGDTFGEMKQFIAQKGYDFTWAIINADMAAAYPFAGVPYDLIIDEDGTIVFVAEGSYGRMSYYVMKSQLDQLLTR